MTIRKHFRVRYTDPRAVFTALVLTKDGRAGLRGQVNTLSKSEAHGSETLMTASFKDEELAAIRPGWTVEVRGARLLVRDHTGECVAIRDGMVAPGVGNPENWV